MDLDRLTRRNDRTAIAGIGDTAMGTFPDRNVSDLAREASGAALDDCGPTRRDIDGLTVRGQGNIRNVRMGEMPGIDPVQGANFDIGGLATGIAARARRGTGN